MIFQYNITVIIVLFCILNLLIISNYYYEFTIYGQTQDLKNNDNNISKVQVGDINIAYKKFGKGEPIVLINGYSESMKFWDPEFLDKLSANHTVIVFDNRGIGNTDPGTKKHFTINQFAQDTLGLLRTLNIPKLDILGYSMGGMIAQELTLNSSNKVDDLILYATSCGGKNSTLADPSIFKQLQNKTGSDEDKKKRWIPLQLTDRWIQQNPDYMKKFEFVKYPSNKTLELQDAAISAWFERGICGQLSNISQDTLVITGADDRILPPKNSQLLADLIPKASLKTIDDGGHKLMFQYPKEFSSEIIKFLEK
jgi:pimeloyl-ACP methyl ester carboxylesterase